MSTRRYRITFRDLNTSTETETTYATAVGPRQVLAQFGVNINPQIERASYKREYVTKRDGKLVWVSYRQMPKADFLKACGDHYDKIECVDRILDRASKLIADAKTKAAKTANVYKSGTLKPAPRPGRRSKSAFGVVRHAAL